MQGRLENELNVQGKINDILKTVPEYVHQWYLSLKASGYSVSTCKDYVVKARQFLHYINENTKETPCEKITLEAAESFMIAIQLRTRPDGMLVFTSESYKANMWRALYNLMDYLCKNNYIPENYMCKVNKPDGSPDDKASTKVTLKKKDFNKILQATKKGCNENIKTLDCFRNRDCLIMLLLMTTGMKESTLSEINLSDIDFDSHIITVVNKKGKELIYPMNEQTIQYFDLWIEDRKSMCIEDDALLVGRLNKRLAPVGITRIVEKYTKIALGRELTPHQIRIGFCSILYDATHDMELVRQAVGHSSITTTRRCINQRETEKDFAAKFMDTIFK